MHKRLIKVGSNILFLSLSLLVRQYLDSLYLFICLYAVCLSAANCLLLTSSRAAYLVAAAQTNPNRESEVVFTHESCSLSLS